MLKATKSAASTPATVTVIVTVNLNVNGAPVFTYSDENIVINEETTITYALTDNTGKGLKFNGVAFCNPFDGIIDSVNVINNGDSIELTDTDKIVGTTSFQFILTNTVNTLLLVSADPQVINKNKD
ncbi:DP-EP family protein [Shewanella goraebulensis]|uniref:DP-EP family protein n=1 Tax=Shewanella goraebulensis TaxID=3050637 RepID=UPI00254C98E6|nr:DP-EP family protein [Shewanella goraebulensis]